MGQSVEPITLTRLALILIPVLIVVAIQWRWSLSGRTSIYGLARMVTQLLVVGYVLIFLFDSDQPLLVLTILAVMIVVASWIALRPLRFKIKSLYLIAIGAISIGSLPVLVISTQLVIQVEPWFEPRYLIPLAGMILSNAMNSISIAAERFQAELDRDSTPIQARNIAMNAAMIPLVNSLFAVGIVSLPGMMTGQVLSGISPLIAARYQILVMCMLFSASGISAACYLNWLTRRKIDTP